MERQSKGEPRCTSRCRAACRAAIHLEETIPQNPYTAAQRAATRGFCAVSVPGAPGTRPSRVGNQELRNKI